VKTVIDPRSDLHKSSFTGDILMSGSLTPTPSSASPDQSNTQHAGNTQQKKFSAEQQEIIGVEESHLAHVKTTLQRDLRDFDEADSVIELDEDLLALRDQIQEARAEDRPALIAHMSRLAALQNARSGRDKEASDDELFNSPYFARITYHEEDEDGKATGRARTVFIGKRSFFSEDGQIKVIDWRSSPMSKLYYTLREGDYFYEEVGRRIVTGTLTVRRMLTIHNSTLNRVQYGALGDQILQRSHDGMWTSGISSLARLEGGERAASRISSRQPSRRGALPDITALIDPDQFSLITKERSGAVIIQGGAGTGKTTIALHRVAYLRFQNPERFRPSRCLIIAPGEALKRYVEQSLPSLELVGVKVDTLASWSLNSVKRLIPRLKRFKLHDETPVGASRIKRHPLILKLIDRRVRDEARAQDTLIKRLGGDSLLDEWVKRRSLPLIDRIKKTRHFARDHKLFTHGGVKEFEVMVSDVSDPFSTWLNLLTDIDAMRAAFHDRQLKVAEWELKQLKDSVYEQSLSRERFDHADADYQVGVDHRSLDSSPLRERFDTEDCVILLRICQVKWGKLAGPKGHLSYEHITVDEAQDLSPVALRTLCDATPDHAPVTLAGDTAQRVVFDNGFQTWGEALKFLPKRTKLLPPLTISYRSTRQVMYLARHLLGDLVHSWESRDFREGAPVGFLRFEESGEGIAFLGEALSRVMNMEPDATIAVVARDRERARYYHEQLKRANIPRLRLVIKQDFPFTAGIDLTEVKQVKGLEYDYVIALDIDAESYPVRDEARHLLHVVATRAAHQLWLMSIGPLSPSPLLPKDLIDSGELSLPASSH
jgi:DNA helicase-2/ATP-dependent DNA helicase PcrA